MYLQQVTEWVLVLLNVYADMLMCACSRERAFVGILEIGASVCHCQTDLFSDGVQGGGCFVIQEDGWIL